MSGQEKGISKKSAPVESICSSDSSDDDCEYAICGNCRPYTNQVEESNRNLLRTLHCLQQSLQQLSFIML